ncbi:ubiquinone/menaquinone biosynthesis methyltransferase [Skermanella stibiiresistens SB22]|uniref:Ubiquinone/menaquinone biosynthesis C-methyltransferase UbiE n=2 Tax=Skermanella TaxID=204447 RepID=W9H0K6_9PROT|nr:ubiquinone/menaquinone biosynthesis methyltransferase [Skermanella stibiiresistens SB22]
MLRTMADDPIPSAATRPPSSPAPTPGASSPADRVEGPESRWFGFREVDPGTKAPMVRQVFDSVAGNYDLMNDLMSGGIHRLWKTTLIDLIQPKPGMTLLDVAGGTGDISFRFLEAAGGPAQAFVCDINEKMILVGRDRAIDRGVVEGVDWIVGDAEKVPLKSRSVDVYTIAFGLRNVTRIDAALAEARRVLKPGGRFFCLEFSRVVLPVLRDIYDRYSFTVLPRLGQMVAGDREAYQYLVESIRQFPDQQSLVGRIEAAGFGQVRYRNLTGGVAAIHSGWRL